MLKLIANLTNDGGGNMLMIDGCNIRNTKTLHDCVL